jgi:hypothetical protein
MINRKHEFQQTLKRIFNIKKTSNNKNKRKRFIKEFIKTKRLWKQLPPSKRIYLKGNFNSTKSELSGFPFICNTTHNFITDNNELSHI